MVKGTILIFIKAPVPGRVKTRLTPALGPDGAAQFYRAMARDTLQVARQVPGATVNAAYQTHNDFPDPSWLSHQVDWFLQEGKDLGERLSHATRKVFAEHAGPAVIVGSDLPTLTPDLLQTAFEHLKARPVVLGPSVDGGYYLIGLAGAVPALFKRISWSSSKVFRQTQEILSREKIPVEVLPLERDIDTPDDLAYLESLQESQHFVRTQRFLKRLRAGARPS
jgi:rSAM/selenodomain-associated transferase 1